MAQKSQLIGSKVEILQSGVEGFWQGTIVGSFWEMNEIPFYKIEIDSGEVYIVPLTEILSLKVIQSQARSRLLKSKLKESAKVLTLIK